MAHSSNWTNSDRHNNVAMSADERNNYADKTDKENWLALFRSYDTDHDGYIPIVDLRNKIEASGYHSGLDGKQREAILREADRNRDNLIDFAEFCFIMSRSRRMRNALFRAAQVVVPKSLREEEFSYLQQYTCCPPPFFLPLITIIEVAIYIYYVVECDTGVQIDAPVPIGSPIIYNPFCRREAWRYMTYMFVHIGIYHIVFNCLAQLVLGIPLELVHKFWRIAIVYFVGVFAGSLAVSVTDPRVYLAGASGGVYALIAAHVANLVVNWDEMEYAIFRLVFIFIILAVDMSVALYNYFSKSDDNKVSFVAHLGGFVAGLLMGIVVLRNFKKKMWERVVWWIALIGAVLLAALCIIWNIFYPQYINNWDKCGKTDPICYKQV